MAKKKLDIDIDEIRRRAKEKGLEGSFLYETTLDRLLTQLDILEQLKLTIKEHGMTVEKSYVKDTSNLYINPAVAEYNRTATAANNTVATLLKIIDSFDSEQKETGLNSMMADLMHDE